MNDATAWRQASVDIAEELRESNRARRTLLATLDATVVDITAVRADRDAAVESNGKLRELVASLEKERNTLYLDRCALKSDINVWGKHCKKHTAELIKLKSENKALRDLLDESRLMQKLLKNQLTDG